MFVTFENRAKLILSLSLFVIYSCSNMFEAYRNIVSEGSFWSLWQGAFFYRHVDNCAVESLRVYSLRNDMQKKTGFLT